MSGVNAAQGNDEPFSVAEGDEQQMLLSIRNRPRRMLSFQSFNPGY